MFIYPSSRYPKEIVNPIKYKNVPSLQIPSLSRCLTQHKHIADVNKLDPRSAVCMMFGQTTAGLRQLAVRAIMKRILFGSSRQPAQMIDLLKENCVKHGYTPFLLSVTPSFGADVQQVL